MNFKRSSATHDENEIDIDNDKDYPTFSDLMREQRASNNEANTVHHRRDLDSLGQFIKNEQL